MKPYPATNLKIEIPRCSTCGAAIQPILIENRRAQQGVGVQWISVKEETPVPYHIVIIHHRTGLCFGVCSGWIDGSGGWRDANGGGTDTVTHWMPLPEPPQHDEQKEGE